MTNNEIRTWIQNEVRNKPELAEEYKKQRLLRLQTELKDSERAFNREGYYSYRSTFFSKQIIRLRSEIQEAKSTSAESLLIERLTMEYSSMHSTEDRIKFIKSLTDEDHYIEGVFRDTKFSYIRCQEDLEKQQTRKGNKDLKKICGIYKKGLAKREKFVKVGEESHNLLLTRAETRLQEYADVNKKIQDVITEEVKENKYFCRCLAEMSVVDAFDQMGSHPEKKHAEKIKKIVELHNPSVVETVIQKLSETPTENMRALVRNVQNAPAQSRKKLRIMKAVDIFSLAVGGVLTGLGIVGAAMGNPSLLTTTMLGIGNLGLGGSGMLRHTRKTNNLDEKDVLMQKCIDDLLNEVVLEETFNQELEK